MKRAGAQTHGRTTTAARALRLCVCCVCASVRLSFAQCPDGTPPPCAVRPYHAPAPPPNSVAVLYLDNLSRDTADAYLADGLTEEIIIRLGQVPRLDVKPLFEVDALRRGATPMEPAALGRALHVAYLVRGSVQRAGDRVRLRYEVIRAATRTQVAGDVIDRASSDILTVESDIAREVATAITGRLLPEEHARLARPVTTDPVAYEEYLRGIQAVSGSVNEAMYRAALDHLDLATARDSSFAAAYATKAAVWVSLADGFVPPRVAYGEARTAATRALALDSSQALALSMLATAVLSLDLDAHEAERLARQAEALDPRDDATHLTLSMALFAEGRMDESLDEAGRAWQADSLLPIIGIWYAKELIATHRVDDEAALLLRIRANLPPPDAGVVQGLMLAAAGNLREAAPLLGWRYYGGMVAGTYVRALLARGDTAAARATVDSMEATRSSGYYNPVAIAQAFAVLGDVDRGIEWLQRAFDERTFRLVEVRSDPELAPLRADPRYASLDRQLKY